MLNKHFLPYIKKWSLVVVGDHIETWSSYLCPVEMQGKKAMLKVLKKDSDEYQAPDILQFYDGKGAVKLLDYDTNAHLLHYCDPGNDIRVLSEEEGIAVFCDVMAALHHTCKDFPTIKKLSLLEKDFDMYLHSDKRLLSDEEIYQSKQLFLELIESQASEVLLHGDLHHYNILQDKDYGWLAIDPKGYIGDPAYEVGAFLRNPIYHSQYYLSEAILRHRIDAISRKLGLDRKRMTQWAYVSTILAITYGGEDPVLHDWLILKNWLVDIAELG